MSLSLSTNGTSSSNDTIAQKVQNINSNAYNQTYITGTTTSTTVVATEVQADEVTVNTIQIQQNINYKNKSMNYSFVPTGVIIPYAGNYNGTIPNGYLACYGAAVSKTTYADLWNIVTTKYNYGRTPPTGMFYLPDFRGMFLRGAGTHGVYTDVSGKSDAGAYERQAVQQHGHKYYRPEDSLRVGSTNIGGASGWDNRTSEEITEVDIYDEDNNVLTDNETRPHNISVVYIIKY